jgi:hypothetical protein
MSLVNFEIGGSPPRKLFSTSAIDRRPLFLTVMSDAPGSLSTTSLKRKRPASDQPSFVEPALSPDSKQTLMDESSLPSSTADIAMTHLPANTTTALDLDGL